jgi:hypothetical protein
MIEFICDSCARVKDPDEVWIVGLAAEAVGVTAARREVSIVSVWDRERAVHPLAVHFCSEECKDEYMRKLFGKTEPVQAVVTTEVVRAKVGRRAPRTITKKAKTRKARRKVA